MTERGTLAAYFSNHRLGRRFPWSLYHAPIDREVARFVGALPDGARVLNVGCGLFGNLPELPQHVRYFGTDIDERAVAECRVRHPNASFALGTAYELPFPDASFDAVFATEVIEHCDAPERWLAELLRVLRPGGRALLTTPNYASVSLNVIEATVLEVIARAQGFTRKGIHPFPCTGASIEALIRAVGGQGPRAHEIAFGWVIAVEFSRGAGS